MENECPGRHLLDLLCAPSNIHIFCRYNDCRAGRTISRQGPQKPGNGCSRRDVCPFALALSYDPVLQGLRSLELDPGRCPNIPHQPVPVRRVPGEVISDKHKVRLRPLTATCFGPERSMQILKQGALDTAENRTYAKIAEILKVPDEPDQPGGKTSKQRRFGGSYTKFFRFEGHRLQIRSLRLSRVGDFWTVADAVLPIGLRSGGGACADPVEPAHGAAGRQCLAQASFRRVEGSARPVRQGRRGIGPLAELPRYVPGASRPQRREYRPRRPGRNVCTRVSCLPFASLSSNWNEDLQASRVFAEYGDVICQ